MDSHTYDLVFLHPPLSFEKLEHPLSGIFESNTGTTDLLTMCPLGMFCLANILHRAGHRTKVFNIAKVLLAQREDGSEDAIAYARRIDAKVYGIGLHWSAHAPGALRLAREIRAAHPDATIIFGGLTSTLYYRELLEEHPAIDVVVLGECEHVFLDLTRRLLDGGDLAGIHNVAYRRDGQVVENECSVPDNLDEVDYFAYPELMEPQPGRFDREAVVQTLPIIRGCYRDCKFCGGSKFSYREFFFRPRHSGLPLDSFERYLQTLIDKERHVLRLIGDTRGPGHDYDTALREAVVRSGYRFDIMMELFTIPSREYLRAWREVADNLYVVLSPESTFKDLRDIHGKRYNNDAILRMARWCEELDIRVVFCLMYAMPGHDPQRLLDELDFVEEFIQKHPSCGIMYQPYLYVDPGSELFTYPDRFGMTMHFRTLADIVAGLTRPYWYHSIGYELDTLSRDELYDAILEITRRKARMYWRHGKLSAVDLFKTFENVHFQQRIMDFIRSESPDDAALAAYIAQTLPPYLRRSNTNLIHRPFMGTILQPRHDPDAFVLEAAPLALEVLARHAEPDLDGFVARADAFRTRFLAAGPPTLERGGELAAFLTDELGRADLSAPWLEELVRLEWLIYLYYEHPTPDLADALDVDASLDIASMDAFLEATGRSNGHVTVPAHPTRYRFARKELLATRADGTVRIYPQARRTFRLDGVLRSILQKQLHRDPALAFEPVS